MTQPAFDLRVEHLDEPFGIDVTQPRLSWKVPRGARHQVAYRIRTSNWDSGRVDSNRSVLVPYDGTPCGSRARVDWAVKVWTDQGEHPWSEPCTWEMGLLSASDWQARWIEPVEVALGAPGHRRPSVLRCNFELASDPAAAIARLYATAHGVYELFLNGTRVGDLELTPGYTGYFRRLQVQTYDIGALLRTGTNELRAIVSDGWFRGLIGATREHDVWGRSLALLAQLELDGVPVAMTDARWLSAPSHIIEADLIQGQWTDLRHADRDATWSPVVVTDHSYDVLVASPAPPMRRVERLRPTSVRELATGHHVVDLGQNINGWLELRALGPVDTEVTIVHGEALDAAGDLTIEHLAPVHWKTQQRLDVGQTDVVVSDGSARAFEPRHTTHGFRYARIEGHPGPLTASDVEGVVVHTDMRRTGAFRCSDPRLNRLHDIVVWSFRTNACDIPTDCPQRERAGWTGDWQIFAPTAAFFYDVAGFSTKWLRDLAADQRGDGAIRNFAPDPAPPGADDHPIKTFLEASAGWGDAAVLVPWAIWRAYGDMRLLEQQWPSMVAWVEYEVRAAREHRHASRIERSAEPLPHEQFLWDTGFHWGEWTQPDIDDSEHFQHLDRDHAIIATAYLAHSAAVLSHLAAVLDRDAEADRYRQLASDVRDAWQREFLDEDGNVRSDRQADHVRALAFDLVPPELRARTAARLVALIRAKDTHLDTGFLATPFLLPVLADAGHLDVAYALLLRDTPPAWIPMVERGATTIWEHWEGIDAHGVAHASLNHYSKGAVVSFLHEYVAGIRQSEGGSGYERVRIAPKPGGSLTWAEAAHDSPRGRIVSSWTIVGNVFRLFVEIPPNTMADIELPDGTVTSIDPGTAVFECTV